MALAAVQATTLLLFSARCAATTAALSAWLAMRSACAFLRRCLGADPDFGVQCPSTGWYLVPGTSGQEKEEEDRKACWLYEGTVRHIRRKPVKHAFQYKVRCAVVDLDAPPAWFAGSSSWRHLSACEAREFAGTSGPVRLLTNPASVGYDQNPISVYYCYDKSSGGNGSLAASEKAGRVAVCIAEVTNTPWGETVRFTFAPGKDTLPKPLHVSPFMDMASSWRFHAPSPSDTLSLSIDAVHPELGTYFTATLQAKRVPHLTDLRSEWFFWLMPHKVAFWIYWQALLLWLKGVSLIEHPKYVTGDDRYRERVLSRNAEERERWQSPEDAASVLLCPRSSTLSKKTLCTFEWTDAPGWPWK